MPCDARLTSAPFDFTSDVAMATPVSLIAVRLVSCDVSTLTPPTTTVVRARAGAERRTARSGSASETSARPGRRPIRSCVRPFTASESAGGRRNRRSCCRPTSSRTSTTELTSRPVGGLGADATLESPTTRVSCGTTICTCAENVSGPIGRFSLQLEAIATHAMVARAIVVPRARPKSEARFIGRTSAKGRHRRRCACDHPRAAFRLKYHCDATARTPIIPIDGRFDRQTDAAAERATRSSS